MEPPVQRILTLAAASSVLLAASLLLPGLLAGDSAGGLADATTAALAFLVPFGVSALLAVYVLFLAFGHFGALSMMMRVVALLPAVFVAAVVSAVMARLAA